MKFLKINTLILLLFLFGKVTYSQTSITLEECYDLVNKNFPLLKQYDLLDAQNTLTLAVLDIEKKPKIELSAQATYQSDVIGLPIATITPPNKDQYRASVSVNQLIYAGGMIDATKKVKEAELKSKQKEIEVTIYQLKKQINQLYFSVLLLDDKKALLTSNKSLLEAKLKEVQSGIKNGVLIPSSDKILEAELLKIGQQFSEIVINRKSLISSLSTLIGKPLSTSSVFKDATVSTALSADLKRPELDLFQLKKEQLDASEVALSKQNAPKIMGFATGGYGNPGLNMLDNSFQGFYTVGVQLNWNVFDWNANKKQREAILINKDIIDTQAEVFNLNTQIALQQDLSEIEKLQSFIDTDIQIIALRKTVLKSVEAQLKNGIVTSSAYITELSNLFESENNLNTHKKQLLLAHANYNTTKGN